MIDTDRLHAQVNRRLEDATERAQARLEAFKYLEQIHAAAYGLYGLYEAHEILPSSLDEWTMALAGELHRLEATGFCA